MPSFSTAKLFNEGRDTLLYRLGLRLKKDNDSTGVSINHESKLPYTTIVTKIVESTPIWVYIVSAICGILFLTLLTYGLYRCGFFRREKREELARLTEQVKHRCFSSPDLITQTGWRLLYYRNGMLTCILCLSLLFLHRARSKAMRLMMTNESE